MTSGKTITIPTTRVSVKPTIKEFKDNPEVADCFAAELVEMIAELGKSQSKITVSLSGGSTRKLLFSVLAENYADKIEWSKVHFFWGDERMVAPDDEQSNFGEANALLLSKVNIPESNVHRVLGESEPVAECARYETEIEKHVEKDEQGVPAFDILMLGMGSDGHTASIFPHEMEFLTSQRICELATHPESGQKRVSVTGKVLNAAKNLVFLVTGAGKADVLAEIINQTGAFESYPTSFVKPASGVTFYIDKAAGAKLG